MFLWYVVGRCKEKIDKILSNRTHLTSNLNLTFRTSTDEVLDIVCAQLRYEDRNPDDPRLLPNAGEMATNFFPQFLEWWHGMRLQCSGQVNVNKYRSVALLIPGLVDTFKVTKLSDAQWGWVGRFIAGARDTAEKLEIDFPESKGRWTGSRGQRRQLDAYGEVAAAIKTK